MLQDLPPNDMEMLTLVLQATRFICYGRGFGWVTDGLTIGVIPLKIPRCRGGIGDGSIDRLDGGLRSTDEGRASINGRVAATPRPECN